MNTYLYSDYEGINRLLLGHSITKVADDQLQLDDGTVLTFVGNMGCAGCPSGAYDLTELNGVANIITSVGFAEMPDDDSGLYQIFVYADNVKVNLATFEGGDGNGYYGTGYYITVKRPQ